MDVTEETFQSEVVDRSHEVPVVVDFWAAWCGPCRMLGPVLEREIDKREGAVELVKLDVDANPAIATAFGIQGIPAVKAFRDGRIVSEFVGAQPAVAVSRFLDSLVPSKVELLAKQGDEASLREALALEPGRIDAALPLARLLHQRGKRDEALRVLESTAGSFAATGLAARIRLEMNGAQDLVPAFEAIDSGRTDQALSLLIAAVKPSRPNRDDIRRIVVGILDELGPDNPLTSASRARLAAALY